MYDFTGKRVLITGASGFLGGELVDRLLQNNAIIYCMARNEGNLIKLQMKYPQIAYCFTGDIADRFSVQQALQCNGKGIDMVMHLAAFKHVGMAEDQVRECVESNTIGSLILLEESVKAGVELVLGISTDKAAQVSGVYGASKLLMERMFQQFERTYSNKLSILPTDFRLVRYGNVLYSTGSVLCKWKELIQEGKEVVVTEPSATRFFWTVEQAVDLIWDCMENAKDATPYCPEMKSMRIDDLLEAMIQKYSGGKDIPVKTIGLQPGENLHEKVLEEGPASNEVEHFTIEEIKELI
tara:strand:+ start:2801 stop:3688 length:888 start_codon:yes stop_codon:yes gene_type:complete